MFESKLSLVTGPIDQAAGTSGPPGFAAPQPVRTSSTGTPSSASRPPSPGSGTASWAPSVAQKAELQHAQIICWYKLCKIDEQPESLPLLEDAAPHFLEQPICTCCLAL